MDNRIRLRLILHDPHPLDPHLRGPQLGHLSSHRKGAGGSADWFPLVFRCRSLGNHRTPGTPLLDCAFVRVGLNSCSVGRRAGLGPAPTESPERRLPLRRAGCFHARAPGGPVCRPYKIRGTLRSFRRGRSQTGPRAAKGRPYGGKRPGSVGSANSGADVESHRPQFSAQPGPSGPAGIETSHPDFARRKCSAHFEG